jgi:hypothetical protein
VDLSKQICAAGACSAVKNGIIAYADSNHLTASFARGLSAALEARIGPVIAAGIDQPQHR